MSAGADQADRGRLSDADGNVRLQRDRQSFEQLGLRGFEVYLLTLPSPPLASPGVEQAQAWLLCRD